MSRLMYLFPVFTASKLKKMEFQLDSIMKMLLKRNKMWLFKKELINSNNFYNSNNSKLFNNLSNMVIDSKKIITT